MEVALFVGAGASFPFGYPTARGFIDECLSNPEFTSRIETQRFLAQVVAALPDEDRDMEGVYEGVNGLALLGDESRTGALIRALVPGLATPLSSGVVSAAQLRADILNWLSRTYRRPGRDHRLEVEEVWQKVFEVLDGVGSRRPYSLITTNYDGIFESLENLGHIEAGFAPQGEFGLWDASRFEHALPGTLANLLKLHGSPDWGLERDTGAVIRLPTATSWADPDYEPVLLPPAEKTIPFMRPYGELLAAFQRICEQIDVLVVIGFAFRDQLITRTVREAMVQRNDLRAIILDPEAGRLRNSVFPDLAGQVLAREAGFGPQGHEEVRTVLSAV